MNKIALYAQWNSFDIDQIFEDIALAEGFDDPEIGVGIKLNLIQGLEDYLETYGKKLRENEQRVGNENNPQTIYSIIKDLVYKLGKSTIFLKHAKHYDDYLTLNRPGVETLAIRIYAEESLDEILMNIRSLTPNLHLSTKYQKPYCPTRCLIKF